MLKNRMLYGLFFMSIMTLCYRYQNTAISMFGYLFILLPIGSFLYTLFIYSKLTYTQALDKEFITKGDQVKFLFSVHNESRWFYPDVEVLFYGTDNILTQHFASKRMSVNGHDKKVYTYEIDCKYRGYYEIGVSQILIRDFLGLFCFSYKVVDPKVITVYPQIIRIKTFPLVECEGQISDLERERAVGGGSLLSNIRPYSHGDSMRQIHWKLTAKKQELIVKDNKSVSSPSTYLFLDLSLNRYDIETNAMIEDKLIECAIAVLYYCLQNSMSIQFIYQNEKMTRHSAKERTAFNTLYKEMLQIKFEGTTTLEQVLALNRIQYREKSNYILLTSKLTYELYHQIEQMAQVGSWVILIYTSPGGAYELEDEVASIILKALEKLRVRYIVIAFEDDLEKALER